MKKKIVYEESSGNVFADLGVENPEEALAKSELARQIAKLIKKKKLTQKRAAEILGIDQPKISALILDTPRTHAVGLAPSASQGPRLYSGRVHTSDPWPWP